MKLTEKTKKYMAIGGGTVLCIALAVAISSQFGKAPAKEAALPVQSIEAVEITAAPGGKQDQKPADAELETVQATVPETVPETKAVQTDPAPLEKEEPDKKAADIRPAQTDQTAQSIQPEVTKPAPPEESAKKDPTQKPGGTKVETPPVPVEHEAVTVPAEPKTEAGQPQAGDVKDGKIYIPGFGYIEDSGPNQEYYAEDMYENGNKIGIMD